MSKGLFLVRMDVAHDHEATFNEVYDTEHVPNLAKVPGVQRASRFKQPSPTEPRYLAAYELDDPRGVEGGVCKRPRAPPHRAPPPPGPTKGWAGQRRPPARPGTSSG